MIFNFLGWVQILLTLSFSWNSRKELSEFQNLIWSHGERNLNSNNMIWLSYSMMGNTFVFGKDMSIYISLLIAMVFLSSWAHNYIESRRIFLISKYNLQQICIDWCSSDGRFYLQPNTFESFHLTSRKKIFNFTQRYFSEIYPSIFHRIQ